MLKVYRALLGSVLLVGASLAAVPAAAERPVTDFTAPDPVGWAKISPSGRMIVAEMDVDGVRKLMVFPIDGQGTSTVIGLGESDLLSASWVNDDWLIARVGRQGRFGQHEVYFSRVVAFRADGAAMHMLEATKGMSDNGSDVIWIAHDGTPRILLSYRNTIYTDEKGFFPQVAMVDVSTGDFKIVASETEGIWDWYADGSGAVRVGVGREQGGTRRRLVYREGAAGLFKEVASVRSDAEVGLFYPVLFTGDPAKAIAFSNQGGYDALFELDLNTMTLGQKVFGVDGYDLSNLVKDPSGTRMLGAVWAESRTKVKWFDEQMAATQLELEKFLPGRSIYISSSSRNGLQHIIWVGASEGISGYYFYDSGIKRLIALSRYRDSTGWAKYGSARYKARDGLEIEAILTRPADREAKNLPVIVMPHGGPRARDYAEWDTWAQFFANRGYLVIQPNFRGSTGYGSNFERAGLGEWGLKMQDDVDDALAWAASEGLADSKRACVIGGSYGGYVALRAAQRNPDLYRCAISFAGVSDLASMMNQDSEDYFGRSGRQYWKGQASDLDAVSPIKFPEQFGIPVLLVHGKKDRRVPVSHSQRMFKALQKAKKNVTYLEQKENDHFFTRDADMEEFLLKAEEFLDKYNPA